MAAPSSGRIPFIGRGVPEDIKSKQPIKADLWRFQDFRALDEQGRDMSVEQLFRQVLRNTTIEVLLRTVGRSFTPRTITVGSTPVEIISPSRYPRGYLILNSGELEGLTSSPTIFSSDNRAPGTFNSSSLNVSGIETGAFFLNVTAGAGTLTVALQSQDPLSSNFATAQTDIFSSANSGTVHASVGQLGIDRAIRLQAVVGAANLTFSVAAVFKGGSATPVGTSIYIGSQDVNTTIGYPILPGQQKEWFLLENTSLFAVTSGNNLLLKIFQLS